MCAWGYFRLILRVPPGRAIRKDNKIETCHNEETLAVICSTDLSSRKDCCTWPCRSDEKVLPGPVARMWQLFSLSSTMRLHEYFTFIADTWLGNNTNRERKTLKFHTNLLIDCATNTLCLRSKSQEEGRRNVFVQFPTVMCTLVAATTTTTTQSLHSFLRNRAGSVGGKRKNGDVALVKFRNKFILYLRTRAPDRKVTFMFWRH